MHRLRRHYIELYMTNESNLQKVAELILVTTSIGNWMFEKEMEE